MAALRPGKSNRNRSRLGPLCRLKPGFCDAKMAILVLCASDHTPNPSPFTATVRSRMHPKVVGSELLINGMDSTNLLKRMHSPLKREKIVVAPEPILRRPSNTDRRESETKLITPTKQYGDYTALVINSSSDMAKEITMQLSLLIPGCSIIYAPTLDLAKWILSRRSIDIILSSPILPDGNVNKLHETINALEERPDLVVVGDAKLAGEHLFEEIGYRFSAVRKLGVVPCDRKAVREVRPEPVKELGADLRNDLNNPLQEIVAMVFVAKAGGVVSSATAQALEAIDRAANNMASVVRGLEEKITRVVHGL